MKIETERLILRPVELLDAEAMFHYRSNLIENKYQGWIPESIDEVFNFIKHKTSISINVIDTWFQLVILRKEDDKLIGDIGIHFLDNVKVELGCTLNKEYQSKGYATEALTEVINYLIYELKKQSIITSIDPRNTASIALVERLGFEKEAHLEKTVFLRGEWVDDVIYGISKEDWIKLQKNN